MQSSLAPEPARLPAHPVLQNGEEALAAARALLPAIALRAEQVDQERSIPRETIDALIASGLFGIVTPRALGGSELGFADLVRVTAEIASACGSTGWVYGVLAGHSWLLNLFPERAQHEVFDDPSALSATVFRLGAQVTEEDGGYRLRGGEGRFCSGIDFATWVIIGNAVKKADGESEPRFFVVPKTDVRVLDDWHTVGMRGTGSRSIRIDDAFIPAYRSCSLKQMLAGDTPGASVHSGAIYRMPFSDIAPFSIIGAPLGIARAMVEAFGKRLGKELGGTEPIAVAEQSARLARLAVAATEIDAAFSLVVAGAARLDAAKDPAELAPDRAKFPRDWAWAAQTARYAGSRLFEACGGSAVYQTSAEQRLWRDVNAAAQHFAFTWDSAMTAYGRAAAGLPPSGQPVLRAR